MAQVITFAEYRPSPRYDEIPWTEARIEEGLTADGTWTQIDVATIDPVDTDPSQPAARNFTTELASDTLGLWYRLVFADASGDTLQPTTPIQNARVVPATQFATSSEFAARVGLTLTADEITRADTLLGLASELIQDETGQTISLVSDDVLTRPSDYGDRIRLPQRPVVSVASVEIDGVTIALDNAWYLEGDEIVRANWRQLSQRHFFAQNGVGWGGPLFTLEVTYTHGWATVPSVVKGVCLEMVARVWANPGAVQQENIAGVFTSYSLNKQPTGLLLSEAEKKTVNDVVRRTSGTIGLR